jgi:hypothetical protein
MPMIYEVYLQSNDGTAVWGNEHGPYVYIGCTAGKLAKRLREHRSLLRTRKHTCSTFQNAFNEFGGKLVIQPLEDVMQEHRREAEVNWMNRRIARLFNEHLISFRPCDEAIRKGVANAHKSPGNRWTPEANEKRRLAQLGKPKGHGAKISATKRAKAMR